MGFLFGVDCGGCSWDNLLREPADLQGCECYCIISYKRLEGGSLPGNLCTVPYLRKQYMQP